MSMRLVLTLVVVLLTIAPASAEAWTFEDAGIPIAYVDNGAAQFQFACRGGDLAMGFWVRSPHRDVAGAAAMNLAIVPDPAASAGASAMSGASFAQDMPLIHSDGTSMIVRGPVARQWAVIAQKAAGTLRVAYVRKHGAMEIFDRNDFSAKGSATAIRQVLARCG
jgi:hypothetical protein